MYEAVTYEQILDRMLQRAGEHTPGIDTRQSSPLYAGAAPAAVELQNLYIELDYYLEQCFADTQTRENLIKSAKAYGIIPYPAVKAAVKGEFNIDIPIGARFSSGVLTFCAVGKISDGVYRMECETAGATGNTTGILAPIEYINGLSRAAITEILAAGEDEEETGHLRARYLNAIRKPSTSGNRYDYYNWALECTGVGAAKIFPLAGGPGTVKVMIADTEMSAAGPDLIQMVRDHIEELRPIGADVTVASVIERPVNVSAGIRLQTGQNLGNVQNTFQTLLTEYLRKEALDVSYVSLAQVGNLLLGTAGVEDYERMLLNGLAENVSLDEEEIAVTGTVTLEVI